MRFKLYLYLQACDVEEEKHTSLSQPLTESNLYSDHNVYFLIHNGMIYNARLYLMGNVG
jgi:hypothetical protein